MEKNDAGLLNNNLPNISTLNQAIPLSSNEKNNKTTINNNITINTTATTAAATAAAGNANPTMIIDNKALINDKIR